MSDSALEAEVARLRDHVAALEAAQAGPVTVDVEGFEGLRDLSRAIENKQLDGFLYDRGVPDKVYFGVVWAMAAVAGFFLLAALLDMYLGITII